MASSQKAEGAGVFTVVWDWLVGMGGDARGTHLTARPCCIPYWFATVLHQENDFFPRATQVIPTLPKHLGFSGLLWVALGVFEDSPISPEHARCLYTSLVYVTSLQSSLGDLCMSLGITTFPLISVRVLVWLRLQ